MTISTRPWPLTVTPEELSLPRAEKNATSIGYTHSAAACAATSAAPSWAVRCDRHRVAMSATLSWRSIRMSSLTPSFCSDLLQRPYCQQ